MHSLLLWLLKILSITAAVDFVIFVAWSIYVYISNWQLNRQVSAQKWRAIMRRNGIGTK